MSRCVTRHVMNDPQAKRLACGNCVTIAKYYHDLLQKDYRTNTLLCLWLQVHDCTISAYPAFVSHLSSYKSSLVQAKCTKLLRLYKQTTDHVYMCLIRMH